MNYGIKKKGEESRIKRFTCWKGLKSFRNLSRIRYNCHGWIFLGTEFHGIRHFLFSSLFKPDLRREIATSKKLQIFENSWSRNSTPSFNNDDEKYRELFVFCSCWAIYKFILCDTIGKIYTVCLIKCIRIEKICSTEERYLAKRERFIPACSKLSFSPIVALFSPPLLSFHIERTRLYRLNQRFETNRMKITYEWIWLSIEKSFVQRINT